MLKNIKNKMSQLAGSEILGETSKEEEAAAEEKRDKSEIGAGNKAGSKSRRIRKPRRKRKEKKSEPTENKTPTIPLSRKEIKVSTESVEEDEVTPKDDSTKVQKGSKDFYRTSKAVEGYEDVLSMLGIKETIETDGDFSSGDMDYIEFSQTKPIGLNHEEVTDFISRMKYTLHKFESALKQRDRDIVKVASEVKKIEQRMIERNQEEELERMIGGMTEEERLIEENMELNVEINELINKMKKMSDSNESSSSLNRKIEALQAENEMLRMGSIDFVPSGSSSSKNSNLPYIKEKPNKLPSFEGNPKEKKSASLPSFNTDNTEESIEESIERQHDELLNDIGGFYDE